MTTHTTHEGTYRLHKAGMTASIYFYPKGSASGREVYYTASPLHLKKTWAEIRREK